MSPDALPTETPKGRAMQEHDLVRVVRSFADGNRRVEAGAVGTIVHVHRDGAAFEIEFQTDDPFVVTAPAIHVIRA